MDPASQLAQVGQHLPCLTLGLLQCRVEPRRIPVYLNACQPQLGDQGHHLLLHPIVEVSFESPAAPLLGLRHARPRFGPEVCLASHCR